MARLTDKDRENILAEFHVGKSQYQLAKDFEISTATINKLCKGLTPKLKDKVKGQVAINTSLQHESERQVKAFEIEVSIQERRSNLVYGASEKLIKRTHDLIVSNRTVEKVNIGDGIQSFQERELNTADLKNLADTVDKASITLGVNQRHASSQVTVNNTNAQQNNNTHSDLITEALKAKYAHR